MSVSQPGGVASAAAPQDSSLAPSLEPDDDDDPMVAYMKLAKKRRLAEKAADAAARAAFLASLRSSARATETPLAFPHASAESCGQAKKDARQEPQSHRPQQQQLQQLQQLQQPKQDEEEIGEDATIAFVKLSKKWKVKVEPGICPEEEGKSAPEEAVKLPDAGENIEAKHAPEQGHRLESVEEARQQDKEKHAEDVKDESKTEIKTEAQAEDGGTDEKDQEEVFVTYCNVTRKTRVKLEAAAEEARRLQSGDVHAEAGRKVNEGDGLRSAGGASEAGEDTNNVAKDEGSTQVTNDMKAEGEVKNEVKDEIKQEVKAELKTELKSEVKEEVKAELKEDIQEAVKSEVKQDEDAQQEEDNDEMVIKSEPLDARFWNPSSFSARLPVWNKMCIDFQKEKNTWAPARPCCLAGFFQEVPQAPPRDGEPTACYYRLTKEQRRQFRDFIESGESDTKWRGTFCTKVWDRLLHPELVRKRRRHKGPIQRRPPGLQLRVDLPWLDYELPGWVWEGHGWMLMPDLSRKRITPTCIAPGSQVFEGRGQVKAPRKQKASQERAGGDGEQAGEDDTGSGSAEPQKPSHDSAASQSLVGLGHVARGKFLKGGKHVVTSKQSGVSNVYWQASLNLWRVQWKAREGRNTVVCKRNFTLRRFQQAGQSPEAADAAALQAALAFREELVRSGQLQLGRATARQSGVPGVCWHSRKRGWQVRWQTKKCRSIIGGLFRPKDESPEEVERARLLAVERRRELEREHGVTTEARPSLDPSKVAGLQSGMPGVVWNHGSWIAQAKQGTVWLRKQKKRFYPTDDTPEELERTRREAVEWLVETKRKREKEISALKAAGTKKKVRAAK